MVGIGSGFGGLWAAIRLQATGHRVTSVEKLDKPGGHAYVVEQDGFVGVWFAMGGTSALVPALTRLFVELGGALRLASEVAEIEIDQETVRASGVRLASGERIDGAADGADKNTCSRRSRA